MPRPHQKASRARAKASHSAASTPRPSRNVIPISLKLPTAYFRILETEANHMGVGRGDFLALLFKRKRGEQPLERSPSAPRYTFTPDELTTFRLYTWYIRPELRPLLDQDLRQMGQSSIASWINILLARWIDHPDGIHVEPSSSRTKK